MTQKTIIEKAYAFAGEGKFAQAIAMIDVGRGHCRSAGGRFEFDRIAADIERMALTVTVRPRITKLKDMKCLLETYGRR